MEKVNSDFELKMKENEDKLSGQYKDKGQLEATLNSL
jgi:hypothetical protein